MGGIKRGFLLVGLLVAIASSGLAQLATTSVQDTVYRADGTPAGGSVVVSWGSFTTAGGAAVEAGTTTVTLGAGGALSIALAPNAGSTPMGSYYTAVFHLNDGTTMREYWAVPVEMAGGGPVKLAAISTQVLPASVAMQTVSKQYVDSAIAAAQLDVPFDATPYVLKAGDTMTGALNLPGDPVSPTQAADMNYVDENIAAVAGGLNGKVSLAPSAGQVVLQPAGTQLETNHLNGVLYATPYLSGGGSNGIGNALASSDCAAGCELKVEATYPGTDMVSVGELQTGTQVEDVRGGSHVQTSLDPFANDLSYAMVVNNTAVRSATTLATALPGANLLSYSVLLENSALTGGADQYPEEVEQPPYFKSTYGVEQLRGNYNTQGQHVQFGSVVNCYGVGDCLAGSQAITSEGGYRDSADEGTHPFDLDVQEDAITYAGTCASGCTTGSTLVKVTATTDAGTQGDGRFLMDKSPTVVISTGTLIGGGSTFFGPANFSGTSFPVSVFLATAQAALSQATNISPGTVTLAIATSGVTAGYATSTAALPATGVACVADGIGGLPNFETANYSVVDATHVQVTLNKVHESGATIAVGGLCGYGLEQTVDTRGAVRQVFPVIGSPSATSVYYAAGVTGVLGSKGQTGAYLNDTFTVASIARTGNVVTVTTTSNLADDVQGLSMMVSGVADSSYNGTYVVTTTGPNTLTYANTGANSTSSGGTLSVLTGGFNLYPMAEVLSVYNAATKTVDGTMTLAPNRVAWAAGDAVEEPHFYQARVAADEEFITQYMPRPTNRQSAGKYYQGVVATNLVGWEISNTEAASDYIGSGGTRSAPTDAYSVMGVWSNDFEVTAGESAVIRAHCNAHTCNRWDSGYSLFLLDSATGEDGLNFSPQSDTATWSMAGTAYSFSPTAFTAGTINVGTLNATTITGGVAGSAITSGTVSAARLPVFGPSGTTHAAGVVPDPGATAGATRYLREDGTWVAPAGSGSGTVTSFAAPSASWPSWLTPTVTNATSTPSVAVAVGSVAANTVFGNATGSSAVPGFTSAPSVSSLATGTLSASNANFFVNSGSGCNVGVGTTTPNNWLSESGVSGCNEQIFSSSAAARVILVSSIGSPEFHFVNTSAAANSRAMRFSNSTAGVFTISACPDSYVGCVAGFTMQPLTGATTLLTTTVNQIVGGGSTPAMAPGAGAGTSPSCTTITGANMAGVISCTTGTATVASATLATVTFNGALAVAPQGCTLMARNAAAASVVGTVYTTAPTTAGWSIAVGGTAVAASTAYSWSYSCL